MPRLKNKNAQTAIEYMLLLAVVMAIILIGLKQKLPRVYNAAELYFNKASNALVSGQPQSCGDLVCESWETGESCCMDCPTSPGPLCP